MLLHERSYLEACGGGLGGLGFSVGADEGGTTLNEKVRRNGELPRQSEWGHPGRRCGAGLLQEDQQARGRS